MNQLETDQKNILMIYSMSRGGTFCVSNWLITLYKPDFSFFPFGYVSRIDQNNIVIRNRASISGEPLKISKFNTIINSLCNKNVFAILENLYPFEFININKLPLKNTVCRNILVIRDPFNYFASILKNSINQSIMKQYFKKRAFHINLWKVYASQILNLTDSSEEIGIKYNNWVTDIEYRKDICKKLDISFSDKNKNAIGRFSKPSSFDGREYANNASEMKVMERWKVLKDDPIYRDIFKDKELVDLSEQIFGHIEGTEYLYR